MKIINFNVALLAFIINLIVGMSVEKNYIPSENLFVGLYNSLIRGNTTFPIFFAYFVFSLIYLFLPERKKEK